MELKKVDKKEKNQVEITFSIDKETFDAETEKVFKKNVGSISVPGFRKGKAPRHIIEKMYGKGVFYDDAINNLLPEAYEAAIKEAKLDVVSQPQFDIVSIDENGVELKATLFVKPDVEIADYMGIEVEKEVRKATDEDVEHELGHVRERNSRMIDITDRAAQKDDDVIIDYEGSVDGVPFEGGKAEKYDLKLGSGQFIPGFEDQIIGHNIGDKFDVNVKFPKEYHATELADKDAVFKVVLHEIKFNELPALDDEFAKDVSEFDTLAEYKADIKAKIQERLEKEADSKVEEQIIDSLVEKLQADIPQAMIDTEAENLVRDYDNNLRMQGMNINDFVKYTGMTLDNMREQFKPRAERQVKTRLALEKIAKKEKISVLKKDIEEEYKKLASAYNIDVEEVKKYIDDEAIKADIAVQKAIEFVKSGVVIKKAAKKAATKKADKPEEKTEKPAAKKTTAKKPAAAKATAEKKPAAKKTTAKKPAAAKATAEKKPAAKKTTTKKTEKSDK